MSFTGTGAIITGDYLVSGGRYDVYLDGKPHGTLDAFSDEKSNRRGEAVWHAFGLKNGRHEVRLVVRGERYGDSTGSEVSIDDILVFTAR